MLHSLAKKYTRDYTIQQFFVIFIVALLIRLGTFYCYIQHEERYRQPDSYDYHFSAVCIKAGNGMSRIDTNEAIFWRTPGYPLFLSLFYRWYGIKTSDFSQNSAPQKAAIIVQIFLCSLIPILLFFLVYQLTTSILLAWVAAWISVFHLGFILASCYLLSDALAQIFFISFLYFFYRSFTLWFEPKITLTQKKSFTYLFLAALSLGLYTWIRPNGQYIVVIAAFILLLSYCSWHIKISKIALFCLVFFGSIGGWYIRNYSITGHWFFCPMSGPYLQSFCAPKIIRRVAKRPLDICHKYLMAQLMPILKQETERLARVDRRLQVSKELVCTSIARPWIVNYPGYFLYDWMQEVLKTTFDLYASQLVALVNKSHMWDPLEEFLVEKVMLCLFNQPMPFPFRMISWIELLLAVVSWIGIFLGIFVFLVAPLCKKNNDPSTVKLQALWLKTGILIGGLLVMTGGFGYARLRIPAEPLLITLTITFWYYFFTTIIRSLKRFHEKIVCSMA